MPSHTHTPDQESTETATAIAEPPAPEASGNGQSFAGRVRQRQWAVAPDLFGSIIDTVARVRLFEGRQGRQMVIKFGQGRPEDKPSQSVIDRMKEAVYRWDPSDSIWTYPVRPGSVVRTRIDAERLYQEVCKMICAEKGIDARPEISR